MRFEVLTAVNMSILVFWVVTPCGLSGRYQSFGGKILPLEMETVGSSETLVSNGKYTWRYNLEDQQRHERNIC
jgi:hypothetical protein